MTKLIDGNGAELELYSRGIDGEVGQPDIDTVISNAINFGYTEEFIKSILVNSSEDNVVRIFDVVYWTELPIEDDTNYTRWHDRDIEDSVRDLTENQSKVNVSISRMLLAELVSRWLNRMREIENMREEIRVIVERFRMNTIDTWEDYRGEK